MEQDKANLQAALDAITEEHRGFRAAQKRLTDELAELKRILDEMTFDIDGQSRHLNMLVAHSCTAATEAAAALTDEAWASAELKGKMETVVTACRATRHGAEDLTGYLQYIKSTLAERAGLARK